jgi:hypothetical protein
MQRLDRLGQSDENSIHREVSGYSVRARAASRTAASALR